MTSGSSPARSSGRDADGHRGQQPSTIGEDEIMGETIADIDREGDLRYKKRLRAGNPSEEQAEEMY